MGNDDNLKMLSMVTNESHSHLDVICDIYVSMQACDVLRQVALSYTICETFKMGQRAVREVLAVMGYV